MSFDPAVELVVKEKPRKQELDFTIFHGFRSAKSRYLDRERSTNKTQAAMGRRPLRGTPKWDAQ